MVAWSSAIVASLTKNEGLVTAILILMLIAIRYQRPSLAWHDAAGTPALQARAKSWGRCVVMWIAPTVPGLVWLAQMHILGVHNYFFGTPTVETLGVRTSATFKAMSNSEAILWVALLILAIGCIWFRNLASACRARSSAVAVDSVGSRELTHRRHLCTWRFGDSYLADRERRSNHNLRKVAFAR